MLRANLGDTVKICFRNRLNRRLSIHVQGLAYDVMTSDGTSTGFNPDSTTDDYIEYTWYANTEGVFLFHDMADPRSSEEATNIHGLFGAVIVEPPGARWFDPETGEEMESGLMADIYQPGKPAFREYTVFFHDELEILDKDGKPPVDHRTGLPSSTTAISYRSAMCSTSTTISGGWNRKNLFLLSLTLLPSALRNVIHWIFYTGQAAETG